MRIPPPTPADGEQNWPLWKRDVVLLILCIMSIIASTLSPLLAVNTLTIAIVLGVDFTDAALLTGYHLCGVGVAGVIFVASARVWGKRHLYLLGTVVIIGSSAWGGASTTYRSLVWARIFQGVGLAPFEALVNATVGDMYFVHVSGRGLQTTWGGSDHRLSNAESGWRYRTCRCSVEPFSRPSLRERSPTPWAGRGRFTLSPSSQA
jgi:hypothetical protein